jgi:hypothetical protein
VIGGGVELYPPTAFCRVQRGFPEASDVQAAVGSGTQPIDGCVEPKLLNDTEKQNLREEAKAALVYVLAWCGVAGNPHSSILVTNVALQLCRIVVDLYAEIATKLVHDPPDSHFTVPPGSAAPPPVARTAANACPTNLSRAQCAALRTASAGYQSALGLLTSSAGDIATGANRTSSAVAAKALVPAFFQEAFAKVNEGAMAGDAAALHSHGKTLSTILRADHLDVAISPGQAKSWLSKHPPKGVSKAQLKTIAGQLSTLSGRKLSTLLSSSLRAPTFAASYKSISLIDLAAIVNGLVVNRNISTAGGQRLAADLTSVQSVCTNASQRVAGMNRFIGDVKTYATSEAKFLSFGSQPLLASTVPASSCGTPASATPTFTGTWNTTFGSMTLTQTGNQVTGTYVDCSNPAATISGTVAGSVLDGTWTEPCHNAQGLIHFVLSADGSSFTGLWGLGSATPTGACYAAADSMPSSEAASACASGAALAPSFAHASSNSTRHLPSSDCCSASLARNDFPERPLKPVTCFSVRPVLISSRATAIGSVLPVFDFQITNPQPGSSRAQHE